MADRSQISVLTWCVAAVATPATIALSLYAITGDQRYRPLSLTDDGLGALTAPSDAGMQIVVDLHWSPRDGSSERALALGQQLKRAFHGKGANAKVIVQKDPLAHRSYVIYGIGHNRLGPFPVRYAAEGVGPSVDAISAFKRVYPELFGGFGS